MLRCLTCSAIDLLIRGARPAVADIPSHCVGEQHCILHQADTACAWSIRLIYTVEPHALKCTLVQFAMRSWLLKEGKPATPGAPLRQPLSVSPAAVPAHLSHLIGLPRPAAQLPHHFLPCE